MNVRNTHEYFSEKYIISGNPYLIHVYFKSPFYSINSAKYDGKYFTIDAGKYVLLQLHSRSFR